MFKYSKLLKKFQLQEITAPEYISEDYTFEATGTTNGLYEYYGANEGENRIVVWGRNDVKVLSKLNDERKAKLLNSFNKNTIIIASKSFDFEIEETIKEHEHIMLKSKHEKYQIISMLNTYIAHKVAPRERVHGSLVNIFGEGVLIIGKSGIGKSELVINLINEKHMFVADDAVDIFRYGDRLIGRSAEITRNLIEIRGIGLLNARKTFGIKSILKNTKINLIIELVDLQDVKTSIERVGRDFDTMEILGEDIKKIQIPVSSGRNLVSIIESAVTVYKHKKYENYSAVEEIKKSYK